MQKLVNILVTVLTMVAISAPSTAEHSKVPSRSRDISRAEAYLAIGLIYEGNTPAAITFLDSLADSCRGEPFYLLIKSRVYRELLTIDDECKDQVEANSRLIHEDLDRVIAVCTQRIKAGGTDPSLRLYRGLAWMSKSHLRSFARSFWRAGRDAKKGKEDLETYLAEYPDHPMACGTIGAFYYFADALPGLYKFISKLLLMPTGDRNEGLRYIRKAAGDESVFKTDFQILLYTVYFLFEGRYEDGLEGINSLLDHYPDYARLASPVLLLRPFIPSTAGGSGNRIDTLIDEARNSPTEGLDRYGHGLLRYLRAHSDRFYREPSLAALELRALIEEAPEHPDWVAGYARFELGRILASQGSNDQARQLFEAVRASDSTEYLHGDAGDMLKDLENDRPPSSIPEEAWIAKIYRSSSADRESIISQLRDLARPTCHTIFYLGDALLLAGDLNGALGVFESVLEMEVSSWDREFQMLAASRAAEIQGAKGDYKAAAKSLSRALDYYHKEFLFDWILEGRQRYYERLAKGQETVTPTLYRYTPP